MKYGKAIKTVRKAMGLTQDGLCKRAKVKKNILADAESEKVPASKALVKKLAKGLKIPETVFNQLAMEESDIKENKIEAFRMLQPALTKMIVSLLKK